MEHLKARIYAAQRFRESIGRGKEEKSSFISGWTLASKAQQ